MSNNSGETRSSRPLTDAELAQAAQERADDRAAASGYTGGYVRSSSVTPPTREEGGLSPVQDVQSDTTEDADSGWHLSDETREIGLSGVAKAKESLRRARQNRDTR